MWGARGEAARKERARAYRQAYYAANRARIQAYSKRYWAAHKAEIAAKRICKAADQLERVQQQTALAYMEGMATGAALALAGLTKPEEAKV